MAQITIARGPATIERLFFPSSSSNIDLSSFAIDLDVIFASSSLGFRELLATVVYGMTLNNQYNPRECLYDCHPRALYEMDIRPVLRARGVPCGQSGPLNVAKATQALNNQWAAQRRPREHAEALLRVVDRLLTENRRILPVFAAHLGERFTALALEVVESQNSLTAVESAVALTETLQALLTEHPLGGWTPQFVCGALLESALRDDISATVDGVRDSVSSTNRTSKKVGDFCVMRNHLPAQIYEVTVKEFSLQRVGEALQSLESFFDGNIPLDTIVYVLCRPQDIPATLTRATSRGYLGELESGGVVFEFIDIYEWISLTVVNLSLDRRRDVHNEVQEFLNGPRIASEVRHWWASAHSADSHS